MSEAMKIVHRDALDDYYAWTWADIAARNGWRVVAIVCHHLGGKTRWSVFAELPLDVEADAWDAAHREDNPADYE